MNRLLLSRSQSRPCLSCIAALALIPVLSSAEDVSSEVAQLAEALNRPRAAWSAGYSDTSYTYQYLEYLKGQQIVGRLFRLGGSGLDKFGGGETYEYKQYCRMVQEGSSFSYYTIEAGDFDGKGAVSRNSLWKSDGQYLRVLQYPIGKPIADLLAGERQTPLSEFTEERAKSHVKGPPDSKDTPWSILKNALGFSTARSPNEVFISGDIAKTIANSKLISTVDHRSNLLVITDGTSTRSIHINTATHLPESVEIVDRNGAIDVEIEITYFRPEGIPAGGSFPKKIVWKGFVVDGGEKVEFLERVCEVGAVKLGSKAPPGEFDIDKFNTPVEALNENTGK